MKISVVIPARNEALFLPKALASLQNQNFDFSYEVIVADNNSTDNTAKIAKHYGAIVVQEKRRGIVYARAKGVEIASGEIIVGMDADCQVPPDFLQKVYNSFTKERIVGLCGTVSFDNAPTIIDLSTRLLTLYGHYYSKLFGKTPICWALNFSFRKKDFIDVGGYNLALPMVIAGYNTQGSDEYDVVKRLTQKENKSVVYNKNIKIKTSGRRFKDRLLYWFFVEHLFGFTINEKLYNMFGIMLPMESYYERIKPKKLYNYILQAVFVFVVSAIATPFVYASLHPMQNVVLEKTAKNLKKALVIKSDIQLPSLKNFFNLP